MVFTTALETIGLLIVSYALGCLFYYVVATEKGQRKRRLLDGFLSLTINFVIFIWVGKIVSQGLRIFRDPLATLAYPSNALAIYMATALFIAHLIYRRMRKQIRDEILVPVAIPVVLATIFIYESMRILLYSDKTSLMFVVFLMVLLLIQLFRPEHLQDLNMGIYLFLIFLLGCIVFAITVGNGYATLLNYRLHLLYFISLFILTFSSFMYMKRRQNK